MKKDCRRKEEEEPISLSLLCTMPKLENEDVEQWKSQEGENGQDRDPRIQDRRNKAGDPRPQESQCGLNTRNCPSKKKNVEASQRKKAQRRGARNKTQRKV